MFKLHTSEHVTVKPDRPRTRTRRGRKVLLIAAAVLISIALLLAATVAWLVRRAWPQVSGTISAPNLQAPVEVVRDSWGVPHIYAENSHDLFFSQGYVQAQDRMWQLDFTRRFGNGRLSETLGSDALSIDRFTRVVGFRRSAEMDWEKMGGEDRAIVQAYADGVNAFLDANRNRLSIEFTVFGADPEPWSPIDTLVVVKLESWVLSENAAIEMSRGRVISKAGEEPAKHLLPPYSDGAPVIVPPGTGGYDWLTQSFYDKFKMVTRAIGNVGASNSWVISGKRTASGKPILANDTHLELFLPSVWYANGLHGGGFDVVGHSLAGTPGVTIGHNQHIAWGVTDLVADVQDLYLEKLDDDENPLRYEYRGEWLPLQVHEEEIRIKGEQPVTLRIARTHHGPLVNKSLSGFEDSRPISIAWAAEESPSIMQALILVNRAENWNQFQHALGVWDGPNVSFVYADVEGNIGFRAVGRIPKRAAAHQGIVPAPGWTGEYDWQGYIPFAELPQSFNPPAGFIVTANQKPASGDYPYRLGYEYADPYRAMRIIQLLAENDKGGIEDSQQIQGDTYHIPAASLRPHLAAVAPANDLEARALDEVRSWNLRCDPDEAGASIYQVWYRFLVEETVGDELGADLTNDYMEYYWVHGPAMLKLVNDPANHVFDDTATAEVETGNDIIRRSFSKAVEWLSKKHGPDPREWKWGRLHTLSFRHRPLGMADIVFISDLFNYGPISAPGGDRFTVNATWFTWDNVENPYIAEAGAAQRIIMDLSSWDGSVGVNSTGQSEQLFSKHRDDLIPLWSGMKYHPMLFTREAVQAQNKGLLKLVPAAN